MKLSELASEIDGVLEGNGSLEVVGVNGVKEADASEISFVANPKYVALAAETRAAALVVSESWDVECPAALIRVKDPDAAFAKAAMLFYTPEPDPVPGIHPTAVVADDAELGEGVCVGPLCVIESGVKIGAGSVVSAQCYLGFRVQIGCDSYLYSQVSVREGTVIGNRSVIHCGTVLGSDGFGYTVDDNGVRTKIDQIGIVQVGDDVEIGANVTIDRARFGKTVVGNGTKIDNQVQIGHNVSIGENCVIIAQVGLAGSCSIGKRVIIAGQSAVAGHLHIGDDAVIAGKTGITKDVQPGEYMIGMPAMPAQKYKRLFAASVLIPKLRMRVAELEKEVKKLSGE